MNVLYFAEKCEGGKKSNPTIKEKVPVKKEPNLKGKVRKTKRKVPTPEEKVSCKKEKLSNKENKVKDHEESMPSTGEKALKLEVKTILQQEEEKMPDHQNGKRQRLILKLCAMNKSS